MRKFCYGYVKPKFGKKAKLCCEDAGSFIVYIKIDDIHKDIAKYVETIFDASNYELDIPLTKGQNKEVIR